jgi:hypothetical protein
LVEFDATVKKYSENLVGVKANYDKSIIEYKKALNKKTEELRHMKEYYDRIVKDVRYLIILSFKINLKI